MFLIHYISLPNMLLIDSIFLMFCTLLPDFSFQPQQAYPSPDQYQQQYSQQQQQQQQQVVVTDNKPYNQAQFREQQQGRNDNIAYQATLPTYNQDQYRNQQQPQQQQQYDQQGTYAGPGYGPGYR